MQKDYIEINWDQPNDKNVQLKIEGLNLSKIEMEFLEYGDPEFRIDKSFKGDSFVSVKKGQRPTGLD